MLAGTQTAVFLLQVVQAERTLDGQQQELGFEGLGEEIVGTQFDRAQRVGPVVLAGEDDHLGVRRDRQDLFEQSEALGRRIGVRR